jgi:hypothetical protein
LGQWEGLLPVQNILKENKEILNCRHSFWLPEKIGTWRSLSLSRFSSLICSFTVSISSWSSAIFHVRARNLLKTVNLLVSVGFGYSTMTKTWQQWDVYCCDKKLIYPQTAEQFNPYQT